MCSKALGKVLPLWTSESLLRNTSQDLCQRGPFHHIREFLASMIDGAVSRGRDRIRTYGKLSAKLILATSVLFQTIHRAASKRNASVMTFNARTPGGVVLCE